MTLWGWSWSFYKAKRQQLKFDHQYENILSRRILGSYREPTFGVVGCFFFPFGMLKKGSATNVLAVTKIASEDSATINKM